MLYEEDDFFYYLKIAFNLSHNHGSSFNGIVPTNGYHPLWLWLLAAVSRLSTNDSDLAVQIFLSVAIFIATLLTYFLSKQVLASHAPNILVASALAAYIALYSMHLYSGGMEIILTIPLVLAVLLRYQRNKLWEPSPWPAFGFGLLLSAMFLSRLDTILIIVLLFAATLIHPVLRSRISLRQFVGLSFGLIPAVGYLLANHFFFQTWLPISGMAKQLRSSYLPSLPAWHSLFGKSPLALLNTIPIFIALLLVPHVYKRLTDSQQVIYPLLLVFPFLYLLTLSCLSDWQLWDWYFYSLRTALCVSFAILLVWRPTQLMLANTWITAIVVLIVFALILHSRRNSAAAGGPDTYAVATEVRDFAVTHPGVYAMGDRAGMVGFLLSDPLIQTEGLVMDRNFLNLIRAQVPLRDALARYNVHYYIATNHGAPADCFHAIEPWQAGPSSAHMSADFCEPHVASFIHGNLQTLIFRLDTDVRK